MRAVVFAGGGAVRVDTVRDPMLQDRADAIVAVRRAAVCGTDLHTVAHPVGLPTGFVLGHEFVGEIVEAGAGAVRHKIGDLVVGADFIACGRCWWCRRGDHWECPERRFFGTGAAFGDPLSGAQAEFVRVPHADVVLQPIPDGVSLDAAVFLGDTLATGYAAVQRSRMRPGDTVVVVGGGPVGQLSSLAAQACGAGVVVVVEPVADRRALATALGSVTAPPDGARNLVDQVSDGRGADIAIEAIGGPRGLDTAMGLVRRRGSVVSVGVHTDESWAMPVNRCFTDEISLQFVIGNLMRDADALIGLVRSGAVDPAGVATEVVGLDEAPQAYRAMAERRSLKTLLVP
jgi:alcohol dehydrogenase